MEVTSFADVEIWEGIKSRLVCVAEPGGLSKYPQPFLLTIAKISVFHINGYHIQTLM